MKKLLSNKAYIAVFVAPGLILFLVMAVIPLFTTGYYGLFNYDGIGEKVFIGLKNYKELFTTDPYFLRSVLNSFILAAGSLFIQIPIALFLAILLANGIKGEGFYRTVFFLPVVISSMVIGQLWCKIFNSEGLLNAILGALGMVNDTAWLVNPKTAYMTTVIPAIWQSIGYHMVILYAGVKNISPEYYEAAKLDGATGFKRFSKITFPLLAPSFTINMVLSAKGYLMVYDQIMAMTDGGPGTATTSIAVLIYKKGFGGGQFAYQSANAVVLFIVVVLISVLQLRILEKREEKLG